MALDRKIAHIDLTAGKVSTASIPAEMRKKYIGGRGIDSYLLNAHLADKADPLSPGNVVVVGAGLLGGTLASASGWTHLAAKSPLSGFLGSASIGGFFAPELRWAGFDHLVIKGKSSKPCYLYVHNGKIEIKDASPLWGQNVPDTQEMLRQKLQDEEIQVLCIGEAGEKLVRFAGVMTRHHDSASRGGIGAVFGSKNLKAIVARGKQDIKIKFPVEAIEYDREIVRKMCSSEYGKKMQSQGNMFLQGMTNDMGLARTNNFQSNQLADGDNIETEDIREFAFGMDACLGCQLHCRYRYTIDEPPLEGAYGQGPGYESQGAWGAETGCTDVNTVLTGNYLADSYGLDILETGSLISWAMELYEEGIIDDTDTGGLRLEFGNDEAVIEMIHRIGRRDGLGSILAEGGLRAAEVIGRDSEKYLVHVKGMSAVNLDERPAPGMALGSATSTSGPGLLFSRPAIDLSGLDETTLKEVYGKPYPYDGTLSPDYRDYDGKAWQVVWQEMCYMAADMIGLCKYHTVYPGPDMPGFEEFSRMIYLNTGLELSAEEIWQCADRSYTIEKLFNIRQGVTLEDDWLTDRFFDEPAASGPESVRGSTIDREKFKTMITEYYRIHGWDENGVPLPETLQKYGLDGEPGHGM
ncbi:aldehyde ferredoxin oxidoreductase family protein [Chloroflexota bacterium]